MSQKHDLGQEKNGSIGINQPKAKNGNRKNKLDSQGFRKLISDKKAEAELQFKKKPTQRDVEDDYQDRGLTKSIIDAIPKTKRINRKILLELGKRYQEQVRTTNGEKTDQVRLNAEMILLDDFELGTFVGELAKKIPFVGSIPGIDDMVSGVTNQGMTKLKNAWNSLFEDNGPVMNDDSTYFYADGIDLDFLLTVLGAGFFNDLGGRVTDSSQGKTSTYHYRQEQPIFTNNLGNYCFYCMPNNAHFTNPAANLGAFVLYKAGNDQTPNNGNGTISLLQGPLAPSIANFNSVRTTGSLLRFVPSSSLLNLSGIIEYATFSDQLNATFTDVGTCSLSQNDLGLLDNYTISSLKAEDFKAHTICATPLDWQDYPMLSVRVPFDTNNYDASFGQVVIITGAPPLTQVGNFVVEVCGEGKPISTILGYVYTKAPNFGPMTADAISLSMKHYKVGTLALETRNDLLKKIRSDKPKNLSSQMNLLGSFFSK